MTNNEDVNPKITTGWLLLTEFSAASSLDSEQHLAGQVHETMKELDLQPVQLERIQRAMLETVQRPMLCEQKAGHIPPVHVRIWIAGECHYGRDWGFFLVSKLGSEQEGETVRTDSLVELFLYREPLR